MAVNTDLNTLQIDPDCSTLHGQARHCHEIGKDVVCAALPKQQPYKYQMEHKIQHVRSSTEIVKITRPKPSSKIYRILS